MIYKYFSFKLVFKWPKLLHNISVRVVAEQYCDLYVHIFICTYIQYRFIYELSLPLCLLAPPLDAGLLSDWMNPCVHPSGSQRTDVMRGQQRDPRWVPRCRSHWGPAGGLTWSLSLQQLAAPCPTSGPGPPPCTTWASGLWGSAGSSWSQVRPPDHFL